MEEGLAVLSLTGREEETWQVDLEEEVVNLSVVCSFLTANVVQFQMHTTLVNLWHLHGGLTITDMGEKRFLFQFYYEIDLDKFLDGKYDVKSLNKMYGGYMRIRVRIDDNLRDFAQPGSLIGKKELVFEWDLSIKIITKRAMVGFFASSEGESWAEYGGKLDSSISGIDNMDSNKELQEEDCPMEIRDGKKR
ncbi:hypothetical protein CXB51_031155 [Gossypium anomalum]|uniref:DUF4283 domain-containing protein n=1 Tax=Gossypium anomalum TaxID=47600 RepID=A0A8J5YPR9_9ROSI|nr:hypothetical protein CXB51_031155 [Gossypium anomalum]